MEIVRVRSPMKLAYEEVIAIFSKQESFELQIQLPHSTQPQGYAEHMLVVNASRNFCHFHPKQGDLGKFVVSLENEKYGLV